MMYVFVHRKVSPTKFGTSYPIPVNTNSLTLPLASLLSKPSLMPILELFPASERITLLWENAEGWNSTKAKQTDFMNHFGGKKRQRKRTKSKFRTINRYQRVEDAQGWFPILKSNWHQSVKSCCFYHVNMNSFFKSSMTFEAWPFHSFQSLSQRRGQQFQRLSPISHLIYSNKKESSPPLSGSIWI